MRAGAAWAAIAMGGCGRVAFDAREDVRDDADTLADAATADACMFGAWSGPMQLPGLAQSGSDDWFPTPSADERELYYYRFIGPGGNDAEIVRATRATTADEFGAATVVPELSTTVNDEAVALSEDGLVIIITNDGTPPIRLLEARRASTAVAFGTPAPIAELVTSFDDTAPWLSPDGLRLTFASRRGGAGMLDIFETVRPTRSAPFGPVVELAAINTADSEDTPTLTADGLEIFFSSARASGAGGWDVYTSRRTAIDQPFAPPVLVPELSTTRDDIGTRLSHDGRTFYFNYNATRSGGQNSQIWIATRSCL